MVTKDYSKSRMRENCTYGSVRGGQSNLIPSTRLLSLTAFQAEGCGGGFAANYKKASPIPVISTEAKRSGEISPPLMVRAALR